MKWIYGVKEKSKDKEKKRNRRIKKKGEIGEYRKKEIEG